MAHFKGMSDAKLFAIMERTDEHSKEVELLAGEVMLLRDENKKLNKELGIARWKARQIELSRVRSIRK